VKWLALLLIVLGAYPVGRLLRSSPRAQRALVAAVGLLPFAGLAALTMNPISYEAYRGDSRGLEVTLVDAAVAVLLFALPPARHPSPHRALRAAYGMVVAGSLLVAPMPHLALFGLWKLLRMYLVVTVMARAFEDPRMGPAYLRGVAIGALYALGHALHQRYGLHVHQVAATFPHQNSLGMALNLVAPVIAAIALAGRGGALAWVALGACAVSMVLTLSRGSIVVFAASTALVLAVSLARGVSKRKLAVAAAGVATTVLVFGKSLGTVVQRFETAPETSAASRESFERAARLMLADHPFGVGMNQFSHVLEHGGYALRAGVASRGDLGGLVHNAYWLTASELGWAGIASWMALLAAPLVVAIRGAWKGRSDVRGDVLLGCAIGLAATYAQSTLEWIPRQTAQGYLFWCVVALVSSLERQVREKTVGALQA
jgi:O-antigen ligase